MMNTIYSLGWSKQKGREQPVKINILSDFMAIMTIALIDQSVVQPRISEMIEIFPNIM